MSQELFDVCDSEDHVIGQAPRAEVHAKGLLHRAVHIWVWRSNGELLVHLRSKAKDEYPACFTSSASGHVDAEEDYETAAHRELQEELGLSGRLSYQTKLPASAATANEHTVLYFLESDDPVKPDPQEIAAVESIPATELRAFSRERADQLSPPFRELLTWWLKNQSGQSISASM